jgi:hypothetical protein
MGESSPPVKAEDASVSVPRNNGYLSDINTDGQDDRGDPFPPQLLLNGEGRFVVEEPADDPGLPENRLAGEHGRARILPGDAFDEPRSGFDDVRAQIVAEVGGESEPAGQVDIFPQPLAGRTFQTETALESRNEPTSTSATETKTKFL